MGCDVSSVVICALLPASVADNLAYCCMELAMASLGR